MTSVWKVPCAPAVASRSYNECGLHHVGFPRKEMRVGSAASQTRSYQLKLVTTMQVSATSDLLLQTSRRNTLLCAPLLGLGLGLLLSPASADARPNRAEGRVDARKKLEKKRDKLLGGMEESTEAAEDGAGGFANQVQDFVEERKAVAAKELELVDGAESISLEGSVENVKQAVNAAAEQVSEAVQEASKSIDTPDIVQSGIKKIQAAADKVPEIVSSTVEKVTEAPAKIAEKIGSVVEGTPSGLRVASSDSPQKLSFLDGLKRIRELSIQGK